MLPVAIVMSVTYVVQIVLLIRAFMPKEISAEISQHRRKGKVAVTKLVMHKAARQQVESGESYAPVLVVSFGFQLVTRLLLYICDMFGLALVHGGFHRFLDCFGAVNMTVICFGVVIRWLLDVSRLTNPKDLQVILRYQKKLVRAGVLSLALILYLQLILVIGEDEAGCWVAFAFIAGVSFAVCVTSMLCYHLLVNK